MKRLWNMFHYFFKVTVLRIHWVENLRLDGHSPSYLIEILDHTIQATRGTVRMSSTPQSREGTPTKRQVSKRQVSKSLVSKRLKRQVYKTSGLQNVRSTKRQVYKTSGLPNVRLQNNIHVYSVLVLVEIRRFCCSHVCRQRDGMFCFLF